MCRQVWRTSVVARLRSSLTHLSVYTPKWACQPVARVSQCALDKELRRRPDERDYYRSRGTHETSGSLHLLDTADRWLFVTISSIDSGERACPRRRGTQHPTDSVAGAGTHGRAARRWRARGARAIPAVLRRRISVRFHRG